MFTDKTDDTLLTEEEKAQLEEHKAIVAKVQKSASLRDSLIALLETGPLWDGDVPSKSGRDELIEMGLAVRIVSKAEDGYTACTYKGARIYCHMYGADTIHEAKKNREVTFSLHEGMKETIPKFNR